MTTITQGKALVGRSIVFAAGMAAAVTAAQAGGTFKIDDTKSFSIGAGLRTSFTSVENGAPSGADRSTDFAIENIRLYTGAQVTKNFKLTFNTEGESSAVSEDIRILDAIVRYEPSDTFNVWVGRFLPPSDRSNLDGPYYLYTWSFPTVQKYPALYAGRDDGVAVWGQTGGGEFKYQFGLFDGRTGGSNQTDNLLMAGRLTYNFWDPEPGYYNSSTYYGNKDILAVGFAFMNQSDGAGMAATPSDFTGYSVDGLWEQKVGGAGVGTVEGAYYNYDLNDNATEATLEQGDGYLILVGYLFPEKVGSGRFQPHVRFQSFDNDLTTVTTEITDVGVNYVIDGHNARMSFIFSNTDNGTTDTNALKVGLQFQI